MREWTYDNEQWTKLPGHVKHLPLFTNHYSLSSRVIRFIWSIILKNWFYTMYMRLEIKGGSFEDLYQTHKKLIIISNHASHLDATSIAASIPRLHWMNLYMAAAKDYFFKNALFTFFSQHCLGAIPIDRKAKKGEAIQLILTLLTKLERIWLIIFPEGTRSKDGKIHYFKRGVSIFAMKTKTPILFLYIDGNSRLWPKGAIFAKPGKLTVHIGPVQPPAPIDEVQKNYFEWVRTIDPAILPDDITEEGVVSRQPLTIQEWENEEEEEESYEQDDESNHK